MSTTTICEYCDGCHHSNDHKDLGTLQFESAYANSLLPEEEQKPIHFHGYYPQNNNFCSAYDGEPAKTVSHMALKMCQEVVNCDDCIEIANKELNEYRDNCYCSKCIAKRKQ